MLTTSKAFDSFIEKISLTVAQFEEITRKRAKTEEYLLEAFPLTSDLPTRRVIPMGSAARGTVIRPVEDIDVMAEFYNKDNVFERYRYQSGQFLQRIRTGLNAATSIQTIGARGQAVRLFYQNGAHVDIAPVFRAERGYLLPAGDGKWISTDPEEQTRWLDERTKVTGSTLIDVIKLTKRWNNEHGKRMQSYHLEVVVACLFKTLLGLINKRVALKLFFENAPRCIDVRDPAGHSGLLSGYLTNAGRAALLSRLQEAAKRANWAISEEESGTHTDAKRLWRIELGDEFPLF
jgi:hypothetical protein